MINKIGPLSHKGRFRNRKIYVLPLKEYATHQKIKFDLPYPEVDTKGYEATRKTKPKPTILLQHISKRLIKAILEHDMDLLLNTPLYPDKRPPHLTQRWRIRKNPKRLSPQFFSVGEKILGRVSVAYPTYALIDIGSTCYGVLHARDMSEGWIDRVDLSLSSAEDIVVYVKSIDPQGKSIRLSLLEVDDDDSLRRPLHSYRIEECVSGKVRRRSPLGFYIDIGATVDAFLHINDRKLPKYISGVKRQPIHVGKGQFFRLSEDGKFILRYTTYFHHHSYFRIQVSENSLSEELDKRVLQGDESTEKQAAYLGDYKRDMMNELRGRELEQMMALGGYDDHLNEIGAHRNSTVEYLLYLENKHKQKKLKEEQDSLFENADSMSKQELRKEKERFNQLALEIGRLGEVAVEPRLHERSVYEYGGSSVWESRVYTPFNENNTSEYFSKLTDEMTSALKDIQGENFNYKPAFDSTLDDNLENRHNIINALWEAFNSSPSGLSQIKDKSQKVPKITDMYDIPNLDSNSKERNEYIDDMISRFENSDNPEVVELAMMIKDTRNFNPFKRSNTLNGSEEEDIKAASELFGDDVTTFGPRLFQHYKREILEGNLPEETYSTLPLQEGDKERDDASQNEGVLPSQFADPHLSNSGVNISDDYPDCIRDDLPDIPPNVLEALELNTHDSDQFTAANIEGEDVKREDETIDSEVEDAEVEDVVEIIDSVDEDDGEEDLDHVFNTENVYSTEKLDIPPVPEKRRPLSKEQVYSICKKMGKNVMKIKDKLLDHEQQKPPIEQNKPEPNVINISEILNEVMEMTTNVSPNHTEGNIGNTTVEPDHKMQKYVDDTTAIYLATKFKRDGRDASTKTQDDINPHHKPPHHSANAPAVVEGSREELASNQDEERGMLRPGHGDASFIPGMAVNPPVPISLDTEIPADPPDSEFDEREVRNFFKNKKSGYKKLVKIAKECLTQQELDDIDRHVDAEDGRMERELRMLRPEPKVIKKTKYTYYPEGIDKHKPVEVEMSDDERLRDSSNKLRLLKQNRRFLMMLKRLNVDPDSISFNNLLTHLPHKFIFERIPTYKKIIESQDTPINDA